jgi:hypothetical protein
MSLRVCILSLVWSLGVFASVEPSQVITADDQTTSKKLETNHEDEIEVPFFKFTALAGLHYVDMNTSNQNSEINYSENLRGVLIGGQFEFNNEWIIAPYMIMALKDQRDDNPDKSRSIHVNAVGAKADFLHKLRFLETLGIKTGFGLSYLKQKKKFRKGPAVLSTSLFGGSGEGDYNVEHKLVEIIFAPFWEAHNILIQFEMRYGRGDQSIADGFPELSGQVKSQSFALILGQSF